MFKVCLPMLPLAVTILDSAVLAGCLAAGLWIAAYFRGRQRSSHEFLTADRSLAWLPVGLSWGVALLAPLALLGAAGEAYDLGWKLLVIPAAVWVAIPIFASTGLPLYERLQLLSIHEYLELRFDATVRAAVGLLTIAWRLAWLGCALFPAASLLGLVFGGPPALWIVLLCGLAIASTWLGGLRGTTWNGALQAVLFLLGVSLASVATWRHVEGGASGVWLWSQHLARSTAVQLLPAAGESVGSATWLAWTAFPAWLLLVLSLFLADPATWQRFLAARQLANAQRSLLAGSCFVAVAATGAIFFGLSLLAYYQSRPERLRPEWLANVAVDPTTDRPRIGVDVDIDSQFEQLVAARAILDPNKDEPVTDAATLRDAEGRLDVEQLATMDVIPGSAFAEARLRRGRDRLLPTFVATVLPPGLCGLFVAGIVAAALATLEGGLLAASVWLKTEFALLARRDADATDSPTTAAEELGRSRARLLGAGIGMTLIALLGALAGDASRVFTVCIWTLAGPILAVFALGMLTRRATATGAIVALVVGSLVSIGLTVARWTVLLPAIDGSPAPGLAPHWPLLGGFVATWLVGYLVSLVAGRRRDMTSLRGLVYGLGKLGVRSTGLAEDIEEVALDDDEFSGDGEPPRGSRWR